MKNKWMNNTPLLDLLFTLVLLFFSTTIIYAMMVSVDEKKHNVEIKGKLIMIAVTWPDDSKDDVDSFCEDPNGNIVYYGNKAAGLMHLDRDDLGSSNDTIILEDGTPFVIKSNRELITIRGTTKGEYTVNVFCFNKYDDKPIPVKVTIIKINPYSVIDEHTVILEANGQEKTICRFTLDEDGKMVHKTRLPKRLTGQGFGVPR